MAFPANLIRNGVKIANKLTGGVQSTVTLQQWTGQNINGVETYGSAKSIKAVVDYKGRQYVNPTTGQTVIVVATLTVLDAISPGGTSGRTEPVDTRDKITLPNGYVGPIVSSPNAVADPSTGRGFITRIEIGAR